MNKKKPILRITVVAIAIALASMGCTKGLFADDELTLTRKPFTGDQLRIDGYYYLWDSSSNTVGASYFFYANGVMLYGGGWPYEDVFEVLESNFRSDSWIKKKKENKLSWGVFKIKGREISFETWQPSSGGPTPAYLSSGQILNDTTFIITTSFRPKTGKEIELNEVYHFKEFGPKPDSTNNFIR